MIYLLKKGISILNVAEKPSVAKAITKILTNNSQNIPSNSQYNPIYKFENKENDTMFFTSVSGHIKSIKLKENKQWHLNEIPQIIGNSIILDEQPIEFYNEQSQKILENLKQISQEVQKIILWTDYDREGELIANDIAEFCLKHNKELKVQRAIFSSLSEKSIQSALINLTQLNQDTISAAKVRQIIDLKYGTAFTRFQTINLKKFLKQYVDKQGSIISFGTCLIPTLNFIIDRYKEVQDFQSQEYYIIKLQIKLKDQIINLTHHLDKETNKETIDQLVQNIKKEKIIKSNLDQKTIKKKNKPIPLNTVTLQKIGSNHLKMTSAEIMQSAEKLYNNGYISYPRQLIILRTETEIFQMEQTELIQIVKGYNKDPFFMESSSFVLQNFEMPTIGKKDDKAHPPIYPIKLLEKDHQLDQKCIDVYNFISIYFLACLTKNSVAENYNKQFLLDSQKYSLSANKIIDLGYLKIYPYEQWEKFEHDFSIFEQESFIIHAVQSEKKSTKSKGLLSESELINLMDKNSIGTDATIHLHIKNIQDKGYVTRQGKKLIPSDLGLGLVLAYKQINLEQLIQPQSRANFENLIDKIQQKQIDKNKVLNITIQELKNNYQILEQNKNLFIQSFLKSIQSQNLNNIQTNDNSNISICKQCQNKMLLRFNQKNQEYFLGCQKYPNCNFTQNLPISANEVNNINEICQFCSFNIYEMVSEKQILTKCLNQDCSSKEIKENQQKSSQKIKQNIYKILCNACKKSDLTIKLGKFGYFLACQGYPECKTTFPLSITIKNYEIIDENCKICSTSLVKINMQIKDQTDLNQQVLCINPYCEENGLSKLKLSYSIQKEKNIQNKTKKEQDYIV